MKLCSLNFLLKNYLYMEIFISEWLLIMDLINRTDQNLSSEQFCALDVSGFSWPWIQGFRRDRKITAMRGIEGDSAGNPRRFTQRDVDFGIRPENFESNGK